MNLTDFYLDNFRFQAFGLQHISAILFFAFGGIAMIRYAKKQNLEKQERIASLIAWTLSITVLAWIALRFAFGIFNKSTDLPFDLCNISGILMPFFVKIRKNWHFQVFYYWIMAGTTQAILTPHLYDGFPHYTFVKYFLVHCGLVILILYVLFVFKMRPTFKGIGTAFLAMQGFFLFLIVVNTLIGSNYGYICHKPDVASLLDYFGPHPWYLLVTQGIALLFFLVYWLPFARKPKT